MFAGLLLITGVVAAVLFMLGLTDPAKRIALTVLLVAVVVPCLTPLLSTDAQHLSGWGWGLIGLGALSATFVTGWKRHIEHRRALHHWRGESPSSLKHRVEEDV